MADKEFADALAALDDVAPPEPTDTRPVVAGHFASPLRKRPVDAKAKADGIPGEYMKNFNAFLASEKGAERKG
ncbi:hypothetical protein [Pseudaestuariivita sp.]|uniref:hypothetical protein n=1 Tax=Pseudaestuariivita sp. TaxID=2211669 RepID=UPI00405A0CFA